MASGIPRGSKRTSVTYLLGFEARSLLIVLVSWSTYVEPEVPDG